MLASPAMAEIQPLRALYPDLSVVGSLAAVAAPPYDVIDSEQRAVLAARSPYNVVHVDLPQGEPDPYAHAADLQAFTRRTFRHWLAADVLCGSSEDRCTSDG